MKYNGIELTPITEPQIFNPPKEMIVWDREGNTPQKNLVCAITTRRDYPIITFTSYFNFCAEIPEEPKPKRATNIQLSEWLAKGNGMWKRKNNDSTIYINYSFFEDLEEDEVDDDVLIRPFGTTEWLEPTLENMGMVKRNGEEK